MMSTSLPCIGNHTCFARWDKVSPVHHARHQGLAVSPWTAVCRFGGEVPGVHAEKGAEAVAELGRQVGPLVDAYVTALEARKLKDGIRIAMAISSLGTPFLTVVLLAPDVLGCFLLFYSWVRPF